MLLNKKKEGVARKATHSVLSEETVIAVEFSPFDSCDAGTLIAYGGDNYVVVGSCRFQEEDTDVKGMEYKTLQTFYRGVRVGAIAWSPETKTDTLAPLVKLCTADADRKLRLLTSDLKGSTWKVIEGHTDYINDLVFEPIAGKQVASVSDDHTCRDALLHTTVVMCGYLSYCRLPVSLNQSGHSPRTSVIKETLPTHLPLTGIWDLDGNQKTSFLLHSPGMSLCWHPEEVFKLMVAEKNGTIRFYDLVTQQAILSLDCGQMPLMSADWCLGNTIKVGAVAGNDWLIWDITRSSYPQEKRPSHLDGAQRFRWSKTSENLFATIGYPGKMDSRLLVHHLGHPQAILVGCAPVASGISWHRTLPLCAIGGDRKVLFWMTEM